MIKSRLLIFGIVWSAMFLSVSSQAFAAGGRLDTSFGESPGYTQLPFPNPTSSGNAAIELAHTPDSGWLALGASGTGYSLDRFDSAGSRVLSYGLGGRVAELPAAELRRPIGLDVDAIGRATVAWSNMIGTKNGLSRYLPDGSADNSFGVSGTLEISKPSGSRFFDTNAFLRASDGSLYIVGTSILSGPCSGACKRLTVLKTDSSFVPDVSWGVDGYSVVGPFSSYSRWSEAVVDENGSLVIGGGDDRGGIVTRLNAFGSLDTTFAVAGAHVAPSFIVTAIVIGPDRGIYFGGEGSPDRGYVGRLNELGILDVGFHSAAGQSWPGAPRQFMFSPDGRLYAALGCNCTGSLSIGRFDATGAFDESYGSHGIATALTSSTASGIGFSSDGRPVVLGTRWSAGPADRMVLARFLEPESTPPTIVVSAPGAGPYAVGAVVRGIFSCDDSGSATGNSGIRSCAGWNADGFQVASGDLVDTSTPGTYTFTVTASDWDGNQAVPVVVSYTVVQDVTPPAISITSPEDGEIFIQGSSQPTAYSCVDEFGGTGITLCVGDVASGGMLDTSIPGTFSFTVTASDAAGNLSSVTHFWTVVSSDVTTPAITLAGPANGSSYLLGTAVSASYACTDEAGGSGLVDCVGDVADGAFVDTSTLGMHSFSVTAHDAAGNVGVVTHAYSVYADVNAPAITLVVPGDGQVVVQDSILTASYSCDDEFGGSGVAFCAGSVPSGSTISTATPGTYSFTVTAADFAGNSATTTHSWVVLSSDVTQPTITLATPSAGASYALGAAVSASYACADEAGGSGLVDCVGTVADGAMIDTTTVGSHSFVVVARDAAGNARVVSQTYTVVGPDTTPPSIMIGAPVDGGTYQVGQIVNASYACADEAGGSGVATCIGTTPSGTALSTKKAGSNTFTVTTSDLAGNTGSRTVSYTVVSAKAPGINNCATPLQEEARWDFDSSTPLQDASSMGRTFAGRGTPTAIPGGGADPMNRVMRLDRGDGLSFVPSAGDDFGDTSCMTIDFWVRQRVPLQTHAGTRGTDYFVGSVGRQLCPFSTTNYYCNRYDPLRQKLGIRGSWNQNTNVMTTIGYWNNGSVADPEASPSGTPGQPVAAAGAWKHITMVYGAKSAGASGPQMFMYRDGVSAYAQVYTSSGALWDNTTAFAVGWLGDPGVSEATRPDLFCDCDIDGLSVWRGAMTQTLIQARHASELTRY